MARRWKRQRILTLAAVVGILMLPAAQGASAAPEEVKIGAIFDLSGPTADAGAPYGEGVRDYVDWYNAQPDRARAVALKWNDFSYRPDLAEQYYGESVDEGAVGFIGWGTADTEALRPRVNSDRIPFLSGSLAETLTDPSVNPYNFVPGTTYSDQIRIALGWIAKQEAGRHTEVAVFHHDSPFGTSPLQAGRDYIAEKHLDIGYQTYSMRKGATDFKAELDKAKAQGAAYAIVHNVSRPAATLATNMADGGYGMHLMCLNYCGDETFVHLAGPAAENAAAVMPFAPPAADAAGMQAMKKHVEAKGGKLEDKGVHYVQGWYTAAAIVTAAVTSKEISGPSVHDRLESSEGVATGDVTTGPIRFRSDSHKGLQGARLFKVSSGRWAALSDALSP